MSKLYHLQKTFLIFRGRSRRPRPPFSVGVQPPGVFVQDYIPPLGNFLSTWLCSTSLKHFSVRLPKNLSPTERLGGLLECMESLLQGPFKYETFQVMFYNPNPLLKLPLKLIPTTPQQPTTKTNNKDIDKNTNLLLSINLTDLKYMNSFKLHFSFI